MSFKQDHNNNSIHLGNYEEYFVMYMDNELSPEEKTMVDDFLALHPDLQAELELLMGTKLPAEDLTIDKSMLFAGSMKVNEVSEDLLLYIDNELPTGKIKSVESAIASQPEIRLQHQLLLKTKLDATETITYPNREELYHRTERKTAFLPWMRVAAAAVVIAAMGVLYLSQTSSNDTTSVAVQPPQQQHAAPKEDSNNQPKLPASPEVLPQVAQGGTKQQKTNRRDVKEQNPAMPKVNAVPDQQQPSNDLVAKVDIGQVPVKERATTETAKVEAPVMGTVQSFDPTSKEFLNLPVTSSVAATYNNTNGLASTPEAEPKENNGKGTVKGLLRRATRLIEKKTGIDPTNDGELLIGVIAVKLK